MSTQSESAQTAVAPGRAAYHHGDLRAALLRASMRMLEAGEPFSLRAVAREAHVSANAPYRHFADRDALESALAAQGLRELGQALAHHDPSVEAMGPAGLAELAELAVRYVRFALHRPALFHLMFANACEQGHAERAEAAAQVHTQLQEAVQRCLPDGDPEAVATAGWAFAHGMASLYTDGKLPLSSLQEVDDRVRSTFTALMSAPRTPTKNS